MKSLVFTKHAKNRCQEYGFNYEEVVKNFKKAKITGIPPEIRDLTIRKYGEEQFNRTQYRWSHNIQYVVLIEPDKYLVLTVVPKKDPKKIDHRDQLDY